MQRNETKTEKDVSSFLYSEPLVPEESELSSLERHPEAKTLRKRVLGKCEEPKEIVETLPPNLRTDSRDWYKNCSFGRHSFMCLLLFPFICFVTWCILVMDL